MASWSVVTLRSIRQAPAAAAALAASHADYPAFRAVFPDPRRRARALPPFYAVTIRDAIPFGAVYAATRDQTVGAVGVWLPPGAFPWSTGRKMRSAPGFLRVLLADPGTFRRFMAYGANMERAHPTDRHWYLVVLGVRPEAQQQGLGSRLMRPALEQADRDNLACYLETSDRANIPFYERFGFRVVDDSIQFVPDGPTHVTMRRPPSG